MLTIRPALALLALGSFAGLTPAQHQVDLLFEEALPPGNDSSYAAPRSIDHAGFTLFVASTPELGAELYRTDGTPAGTTLVRDIRPGPSSSKISNLVHALGAVYFFARTDEHGFELWRTDATTAGTQRVLDLMPGPPEGVWTSGGLVEVNGVLLFVGRTATENFRLFGTDGTQAGTQPVLNQSVPFSAAPLLHEQPGGVPGLLVTGALGFQPTGAEPWITDGTPLGTQVLLDIVPGALGSSPAEFIGHAGKVYFTADDQVHGRELWVTDGTSAGTQLVHDSVPGPQGLDPDVDGGVSLGATLHYMSADGRLWSYAHGQGAPTAHPLPPGVTLERTQLLGVGAKLVARTRTANGRTLHVFDPGSLAWSQLATIPTLHPKLGWEGLTVGGWLYFRNYAQTEGFELWASDGTPSGTGPIAALTPGITGFGPRGLFADGASGVYFFQSAPSVGEELHRATPSAASFVADLAPNSLTTQQSPSGLTTIGGLELYSAAGFDQALQRWNPRTGLEALTAGRLAPQGLRFTSLGPRGTTFFSGRTPQSGRELWRTQGTAESTRMVLDLWPGVGSAFGAAPVELNGTLYFQAREQFDYKLYRSDGTGPGTSVVVDLVPNASSKGVIYALTPWRGKLYFSGTGPNVEFELFVSDGTPAGTQKLAQVIPGTWLGTFDFVDAETHLAWVVSKTPSTIFNDLWVADGVTATKLDQFGESIQSVDAIVGYHDGELYVFANTASGLGFWRVSPTTGAAHKVGPFTSGLIYEMLLVDGEVYVMKEDFPGKQRHVVRIDEATQSEVYLTPQLENDPYADPVEFAPVGDTLYFTARTNGVQELYLTDGTPSGTQTLESVMAPSTVAGAPWASEPRELTLMGGALAFVGEDPAGLPKVYRIAGLGAHSLDLGPSSGGYTLRTTLPKLGQALTVRGAFAPAGPSALYLSVAAPRAHSFATAPGSLAWLDPQASVVLGTTTTPEWSLSIQVPAAPALAGSSATLQSWSSDPVPTTSNGVLLVLGS